MRPPTNDLAARKLAGERLWRVLLAPESTEPAQDTQTQRRMQDTAEAAPAAIPEREEAS